MSQLRSLRAVDDHTVELELDLGELLFAAASNLLMQMSFLLVSSFDDVCRLHTLYIGLLSIFFQKLMTFTGQIWFSV